ncbi:hypothetical protein FIBSPDRAFT_902456 [Athelia psychrophila]|uniref:Uncharacterized protein n=1 Tax=Athelia psychrophila TaxID=1759441 RepID=A0A167X751_9AGAM|nr:hypothetical protein FIBSPDRAFT_902456 [Fibularhizoctonia sp. CBS 109695]
MLAGTGTMQVGWPGGIEVVGYGFSKTLLAVRTPLSTRWRHHPDCISSVGLLPYGNSFEKAYLKSQSKVVQPWYNFLRFIYRFFQPKRFSNTVPAPVLTSPKGSSPSPTTVQDTMVATPSITDVVMCASPKTMQEDVVMSTSPNIVQQNIMMDTDTSPSGFGAQDRRSPSQFLDEEQLEMYLDYFADTATKTKDGQDFFKLLLSHEGNYSIARVHIVASPASLEQLANQTVVEAIRRGKTAPTPPLETPARAASGSDTTSAMPVDRGAAGMARAARMAATAQLNAEAIKRAELVADEAITKKDMDSQWLLASRVKAAAAVHKQKELAAISQKSQQPGQPSKEPAAAKVVVDNQLTQAAAEEVATEEVPSMGQSDKEHRKSEALVRSKKTAEKRKNTKETKQVNLAAGNARIQKITDVAASSAVAKVAAAPAGDVVEHGHALGITGHIPMHYRLHLTPRLATTFISYSLSFRNTSEAHLHHLRLSVPNRDPYRASEMCHTYQRHLRVRRYADNMSGSIPTLSRHIQHTWVLQTYRCFRMRNT